MIKPSRACFAAIYRWPALTGLCRFWQPASTNKLIVIFIYASCQGGDEAP